MTVRAERKRTTFEGPPTTDPLLRSVDLVTRSLSTDSGALVAASAGRGVVLAGDTAGVLVSRDTAGTAAADALPVSGLLVSLSTFLTVVMSSSDSSSSASKASISFVSSIDPSIPIDLVVAATKVDVDVIEDVDVGGGGDVVVAGKDVADDSLFWPQRSSEWSGMVPLGTEICNDKEKMQHMGIPRVY